MPNKSIPTALIILDGWGRRDDTDYNAIALAQTPVMDDLWDNNPHTSICTSGAEVGLPSGQMGNSEVGHLNLGAGRVVYQEFTRVSRSVRTGSFYTNRTLTDAVDRAIENNGAVHIIGLLSPGGVHSHEDHIHAMVKLAVDRGCKQTYVHALLDGRDMPPKGAEPSLMALDNAFKEIGGGILSTLSGRFYGMDRDARWERIKVSFELMTEGTASFNAEDGLSALNMAYERGETDEFMQPTLIGSKHPIRKGDSIIFMNYRSDRARQLTRAFIEEDFPGFERSNIENLTDFTSLTEYNETFKIPVAFPPERLKNVLGEHLARKGMFQLRIAETEKYAHVTFFFNGGREQPFPGEERILINSPQVKTYDLQPEMSSDEVTNNLVDAIKGGKFDTIICNYANSDMVGHTGKLDAAIKAVEVLDTCIGRVRDAIQEVGGDMLVTADHGNSEQMLDRESGQPYTAHTTNPVPLIYYGTRDASLEDNGALCDIAPSLLEIMGLDIPNEMTGRSLIKFKKIRKGKTI